MRKTARDILEGDVSNEDRHVWLAEATVEELYAFLRWVKQDSSWALHGRDALNVLLAKENIRLQKAIKKLTIWIFALTFVMVIIGFIQVYPILKNFNTPSNISLTTPQATGANKQPEERDQPQNQQSQPFEKSKAKK